MPAKMTLRERVSTALKGGLPDQIPFTSYPVFVPDREVQRLGDLGLALVERVPPYTRRCPNVEVETREIAGEKHPTKIVRHRTPVGELTQKLVYEPGYGSGWIVEHLVKRPEDYDVLEFMVRDEVIEPDIDQFVARDRAIGDRGMAVPNAADPTMQELWRRYTGMERFGLDWYDCRDQVRRVLDAMSERNETIWKIAAETPSDFCISGGNISGDIIGPPMFDELIMPHFEAEARVVHPSGKKVLNHMDGFLKSLVTAIARCPVDVVEAFNPLPDGNLPISTARQAWPGKAISTNFPSSIHLQPHDQIRATTLDLLRAAAPGDGFVVGITEDVPRHLVADTLTVIAQALNELGACPLRDLGMDH